MARKQNWLQRLLRIEPGIALGQWVYERIFNNWAILTALFGSTVMGYLAAITDILEPYGAFGIATVALITALLIWAVAAWAMLSNSRRRVNRAREGAIEKWKQEVDGINPLDLEFHRKRIKITDLIVPIAPRIAPKRFMECELVGPANIIFVNGADLSDIGFLECDLVVPKDNVLIRNVIIFERPYMRNCTIAGCTIYVQHDMIPMFKQMGAPFVTLTGDPEIDTPKQSNTGSKTPQ